MAKAWPYVPGVPAAGHITSRGYWHAGPISGCTKCEPASTNRDNARSHPRR